MAIITIVNANGFLVGPFKKLNIFGSMSSSAIEFIIFGELLSYYKAEPDDENIIPIYTIHL